MAITRVSFDIGINNHHKILILLSYFLLFSYFNQTTDLEPHLQKTDHHLFPFFTYPIYSYALTTRDFHMLFPFLPVIRPLTWLPRSIVD
ncbi:hypothetical protein WH95_01260 [Kiloniella litopenaei]|uniref:Uncharacterized protein n=1 Tax=Kiloniella litopenaei TaxID=1549748 RepID=A0A0M2RE77_9PROT|nr:hypothetical protein WH95_01260 [Kiloniella litopenaei]